MHPRFPDKSRRERITRLSLVLHWGARWWGYLSHLCLHLTSMCCNGDALSPVSTIGDAGISKPVWEVMEKICKKQLLLHPWHLPAIAPGRGRCECRCD